jgi:transcriptional regulator with XRE-family HTH domain
MGQAEFADELKEQRGRLSRAKLAILSGVSESTIERLETKRGDAPKLGRYQAIDLASALGWDINEALKILGEGPLSARERTELESEKARRVKLDRLWLDLTARQQHSLVEMVASMVVEDAPQTPAPGGHRETRVTPGSGTVPKLPDPRDKGESGSD